MKKFLMLFLACLLTLTALAGCQQEEETWSVEHVTYTVDLSQYPLEESEGISGDVLEVGDGVLLMRPSFSAREELGEVIYVSTGDAGKFKPDDTVAVTYTVIKAPEKEGYPLTIVADEIFISLTAEKPMIYLYPEDVTVCSVKVVLDGQLTCTYPAHGEEGWHDFTAAPDGTLTFPDGRSYYGLYWEGTTASTYDFTTGYCVKGCDTAAFLSDILPRMGLSDREANEFIIYWLPIMQDNAYNVISFQTDAYTDTAVLEITPTPDSLLRVFMAWYPSEEAVDIPAQEVTPFVREGFTVVEWGGSQVKR